MKLKLFITDIDGVWTDSGMYYDVDGNELKRFSNNDGVGVHFLRINDIDVAIMTGENTTIVTHRAKKLGIEMVFLGIRDKLSEAKKLCSQLGLSLDEVAYIGDNVNDIPLLRKVGFSATVPKAPNYVKREVDYITKTKGGDGAFRDVVEYLLEKEDLLDITVNRFIERITL
ncbi:MAG TPA: HAD hydrolase family protein [Balneolales bacterium]|nr:HAD hydrolase family protein [Balneolales bacterium]